VALQEVVVALLADQSSHRALYRFTQRLALALTAIAAAVTLTPLAGVWFTGVAGLPADLAAMAGASAALLVAVPALTVLTSWQRGTLVCFSRTGAITVATAINIAVLLAVVLGGVRVLPWPGALTAALALSMSLLAEVVYLTAQTHSARRVEAWV
jgi:hypothetical protein